MCNAPVPGAHGGSTPPGQYPRLTLWLAMPRDTDHALAVPPEAKLACAGLAVAGTAMVLGITVVPTHLGLGAGSIRCGTVLHPDRSIEVANYCGPAGAHQLRVVLGLGAVLGLLALVPMAIALIGQGPIRTAACTLWGTFFLIVATVGVASLGLVEYSPPEAAD